MTVKLRMTRRSWIVAAGLALFMTLAGTGASYALWNAQASASATVSVGAVGITMTGGESLAVDYSASQLQKDGALVITNTGTVTSTYATATTLLAGSSATMAGHVVVTTWSAKTAADCSAAAPATAVAKTWSTMQPLTGSLAAGASTVWCVRTSLTSAQLATDAAASVSPSIAATATVGTWKAASTVTATQAVPKATIPETSCADILGLAISLSWTRPLVAPPTATYFVYVNNIKVAGPLTGATMTQRLTNTEITATVAPNAGPTAAEIRQVVGGVTTVVYSTPITISTLLTARIPHCA